jgi:hypothetical protein
LIEPRSPPQASGLERALVAAGAVVFLQLVCFRGGTPLYLFNPNGSGLWIDEAYRVWAGEAMYRDFFEFVPPGVVYLNAAVIAVFGPRIAAFSYLAVALGTLGTVLCHALAGRLLGPGWRLLPPALYAVIVYASDDIGDHKVLPPLFGLLALLSLVRRSRSSARLLAAGACAGLGMLCTMDLGLGIALGLLCGLALDRTQGRGLLAFALGCLAPVALALGWFAMQAGLGTVLYDTLVFPVTRYRRANPFVVFADLGEPRVAVRTLTRLALGVGALLSALALLSGARPFKQQPGDSPETDLVSLRLVALAGLGMALAHLQRAVYPLRLAAASALLLVPLAAALETLSRRPGRARQASRGLLALLVFGSLWSGLGLVYRRQWEGRYSEETHRAGALLAPVALPELSWIEQNTRPGEEVFLLPNKGGLYLLSHTRNVTSFSRLELGGLNPPAQVTQALAEIERRRPAVGLLQEISGPLPSFVDGFSLEPLYTGIRRRYKCEGRTPNGVLLLRLKGMEDVSGVDPCG